MNYHEELIALLKRMADDGKRIDSIDIDWINAGTYEGEQYVIRDIVIRVGLGRQ